MICSWGHPPSSSVEAGSLILTIKIHWFDGHKGKRRVKFTINYIMVMTWNELYLPLKDYFESGKKHKEEKIKLSVLRLNLAPFFSRLRTLQFKDPTKRS